MRIDILSWLLCVCTTSLNFLKALAIPIFLISFTKQELKILIFFGTFEIETTSKTLFLSRPFISFCLNFTNDVGVRRGKKFFSCKKVKTLVIFWYLIRGRCTWKGLLISIEKVLVVGKDVVPGGKSWVKGKKFAVGIK